MTLQQATQQLEQLRQIYDLREVQGIGDLVMEHLTGWKRIERLLNRQQVLSPQQETGLAQFIHQLLQHRPVQYVLGEAWFCGMKLFVDERVLIPRPETEELVDWMVEDLGKRDGQPIRMLDVGTGSGCIALAIKKEVPETDVWACDVSPDALQVAQKNAAGLKIPLQSLCCDFLDEAQWNSFPPVDMIVSNPPYIPVTDQAAMRHNVLGYEPHGALFVPAHDPLLFYRAIALFVKTRLPAGGAAYVEIHEAMANRLNDLFSTNGLEVENRKDLQGKDRMMKIGKH